MSGTCRTALFAAALVALVFSTNAISGDGDRENHYILCDQDHPCPAGIAAPTFRIESLYSNLGGWFQYIELRKSSDDGKVTPLAGSVITVRHGSVVKHYVIQSDPGPGFPAGGTLVISSSGDWASSLEYVMPERFLPTDGGTIDLDGQDPWIFSPLPTDGSTKLLRAGTTAPAKTGQSFALGNFPLHLEIEAAIEYYNEALGHYFISASGQDVDAIESGRINGWKATGLLLGVGTTPASGDYSPSRAVVPVCRFYIPPAQGDSHFFSAIAQECRDVATKFPTFVLENAAAFFVVLPDKDTGACPLPLVPVYRLWNQRADTNHRYIANSIWRREEMIAQGWLPEGLGPLGVAWCQ